MRTLTLISMAILGWSFFTQPSCAQVTNLCPAAPATKLESFDTNADVVILNATTEVGSVSTSAGNVAVRCREVTDTSTGNKEQGIAIEVTQEGRLRATMLIDYDEIPSLVTAMDYLSKLDMSVTKLNFVDAAYTTKGGFRIAALASRRTGVTQVAVRDARNGLTPVIFSREQMAQFSALINQAETTLASLRGG
jgi:hypothetical protein